MNNNFFSKTKPIKPVHIPGKRLMITKQMILDAQSQTKSGMEAARWLGVSYPTYKKHSKKYNIFEQHFNQSGQGVFGNLQAFSNGNEWTAQKIVTNFEPGRLVLFPSTLLHEVAETEIDTPRVTLSFNTFFRGEIGDVPNLTLLKIK